MLQHRGIGHRCGPSSSPGREATSSSCRRQRGIDEAAKAMGKRSGVRGGGRSKLVDLIGSTKRNRQCGNGGECIARRSILTAAFGIRANGRCFECCNRLSRAMRAIKIAKYCPYRTLFWPVVLPGPSHIDRRHHPELCKFTIPVRWVKRIVPSDDVPFASTSNT